MREVPSPPRTPRARHGEGSTPTVARRTPDIAEVGFIIERLEVSLAIEPLVWQEGRTTAREDDGPSCLELVSKLFPAVIGCEARGSALSAKKVLGVLQYASEPFPLPALSTDFSLDFASEPVWKPVLGNGKAPVSVTFDSEGIGVLAGLAAGQGDRQASVGLLPGQLAFVTEEAHVRHRVGAPRQGLDR